MSGGTAFGLHLCAVHVPDVGRVAEEGVVALHRVRAVWRVARETGKPADAKLKVKS